MQHKNKTFISLGSGSKGNTLYYEEGSTKFLIDAGLSCRAIEQRLAVLGKNLEGLKAVFVTHEHTDHIIGLKRLVAKYQIPVFCNAKTAEGIASFFDESAFSFHLFSTGETFLFEDFEVSSFSIMHDTPDPVGFVFKTEGLKLGVCADLGCVTPVVERALKNCNLLYLEANHEPGFLHASNRPEVYKNRVLGRFGHLSNQQSAELLVEIAHDKLEKVFLAHLSQECNSHSKAQEVVETTLEHYGMHLDIEVASQDKPHLYTL